MIRPIGPENEVNAVSSEGEGSANLVTLELEPGRNVYPIRAPNEAEPEPFGVQPNTIWLAPRSVKNMIELAGGQVEIPKEHAQKGLAVEKSHGINTSVDLPFIYPLLKRPAIITVSHSAPRILVPYR